MRFVFDTEVILKFYLGEDGAQRVKEFLEKVADRRAEGFVSYISLAEFYYILYRRDPKVAEEKVNNLLSFGIKPIGVKDNWKIAAKFKAEKNIPLGDAFAAAAAKSLDAILIVGKDSDFDGLGIEVERV